MGKKSSDYVVETRDDQLTGGLKGYSPRPDGDLHVAPGVEDFGSGTLFTVMITYIV